MYSDFRMLPFSLQSLTDTESKFKIKSGSHVNWIFGVIGGLPFDSKNDIK